MAKKEKKVLMICYYFPPCQHVGALRSGKFVKYLGRFGWHSEVLTAYSGRAKEYEDKQDVKIHCTLRLDIDEAITKLVSVSRWLRTFVRRQVRRFEPSKCVGTKPSTHSCLQMVGGFGIAPHIQRWLLLPDCQCIWILLALPKALWLARKCDVIYTSLSPFSAHVLGLITKKLTNKPWVADYRDEWSLNCRWNPPTKFHKWLGEKLDRICVRNADIVINTTEVRTQMFIEHFGRPKSKYITIHNGYDEDDIAKFRGIDPSRRALVITSIGSFYGGRNPRSFFKAVAQLVNHGLIGREEIKIQLIGGQNPDLVRAIERLEIGDVIQILPKIPQDEAFVKLSRSHIALLVGSDMEKVAMTTKLYEYAGMGKTILALVPPGPVCDFVTKCGGWCVNGTDQKEILKVIIKIFERYKSGRLETCHRPTFIERYERRTLTKQLAYCFDGCIK